MSRLTAANYVDISNSGAITGNRFTEKVQYDIRGNIKNLQRYGLTNGCGWGLIDNLDYSPMAQGLLNNDYRDQESAAR